MVCMGRGYAYTPICLDIKQVTIYYVLESYWIIPLYSILSIEALVIHRWCGSGIDGVEKAKTLRRRLNGQTTPLAP